MRLYVNGVLETMKSLSGSLWFANGRAGLAIGGYGQGVAGDVLVAATLDEVAIYGTALSPQQVMTHYTAGAK